MRDLEIELSLGVRLNRVLFPNLRRPDRNNGRFINRIFPLDSLNLTKVATRPTRAEGPQHAAELPFHPVEELHIVAPSPAPASPLLAHELVMPCQISELGMRTIPGFHTPPQDLPSHPRLFQHPMNRCPVLPGSRYPYLGGPVP